MTRKLRRAQAKRRRKSGPAPRATVSGSLAALAALGAASGAEADTFTVDSTSDPGNGVCDEGGCTLREALDYANANNNPGTVDQILFTAAVTGTITLVGGQLPTIDEPLNIVGPGAGTLTISGNDSERAFYIDTAPGAIVAISGLRLIDGKATYGGAIGKRDADLTVSGATITGNDARYGGGILSVAGGGTLTVQNSTISDNTADSSVGDAGGGGIAAGTGSGSVLVQNSTLQGNGVSTTAVTGDARGGAVDSVSDLTIEGSTISGNTTHAAGNGYAFGAATFASTQVIRSSTLSGNTATAAGSGRAAAAVVGDSVTIERSTISGNATHVNGVGTVYAFGGGVYGDPLTIANSTVSGNSATTGGGGSAGGGGAFSNNGTLRNSIVANNTVSAGTTAGPDAFGTFTADFALVENPSGATLNTTVPGSNLTGQDPQLGPLAQNGGPTQTMALPQTSPAVDAGMRFGTTTDQRGSQRPLDIPFLANSAAAGADGSDIGAFELQSATAPPPGLKCRGKTATIVAGGGVTKGTGRRDVIVGTDKRDVIKGRGGNDLICALGGNDKALGGGGNDTILGGKGRDTLLGQGGRDLLLGQAGPDLLKGGPGRDKLRGGPGRDRQRQ